MGSHVILIGQKYNKGAKQLHSSEIRDPAIQSFPRKPSPAIVHIYIKGRTGTFEHIANAKENHLRRFTCTGRQQLPPVSTSNISACQTDKADEDVKALSSFTADMTLEYKRSTISSPAAETGSAQSKNNYNDHACQPTAQKAKHLILSLDVDILPSPEAFSRIRDWMHTNHAVPLSTPLTPLLPPDIATTELVSLIDTYAAALALGLLPRPDQLRLAILKRTTERPLLAADLAMVWRRVPRANGIVMRAVRAYYEHVRAGRLDETQIEAVWTFTNAEPELDQKFLEVEVAWAEREGRCRRRDSGFGEMGERRVAEAKVEVG